MDQTKITPKDIADVKLYRAESAENRAKAHYIYTSFKHMVERNKIFNEKITRRRNELRKLDEEDSDGETTGEIALLKKGADKDRGRLVLSPPTAENPYGSFMKLSPNYEGNLGKTSPVAFVDIGKPEVSMDEDDFNDRLLRRGGKRTRRRRKKLKRKTKRRKKRKRKTKRKRIRRKRTRKRV